LIVSGVMLLAMEIFRGVYCSYNGSCRCGSDAYNANADVFKNVNSSKSSFGPSLDPSDLRVERFAVD